jgi:hypothetical protein
MHLVATIGDIGQTKEVAAASNLMVILIGHITALTVISNADSFWETLLVRT